MPTMLLSGMSMSTSFTYTDEKKFTKEQTQRLFLSVGWVSGQYP